MAKVLICIATFLTNGHSAVSSFSLSLRDCVISITTTRQLRIEKTQPNLTRLDVNLKSNALHAKSTEQAADVPADSTRLTAEKPLTETPVTENTEMEAPAHTVKAEKGIKTPQEESQDIPVSPHGFGAFPDVPQGFPENIRIPWQWQEIPYDAPKELAVRVLIKLWEQGDTRFTGAQYTDDYKIYPYYPNTAYVRYRNTIDEDGTPVRYISGIRGGPDLPEITSEMLDSGVVPGVQLISEEQGGIDALQFLNLE